MILNQKELWTLRALIQKCGWSEFMGHIGSFMAEQSGNVKHESEQEKNLFQCSIIIHTLNTFFEQCGTFDYRHFIKLGWVDPEYVHLLEENPPQV